MVPRYLGPFVHGDLPGRRALRSAVTNRLTVPAVKLSTIGGRAFSISSPQTWNQLPEEVTSATSLSTFQRHLKTFLFRKSFPGIIADWHFSDGPYGKTVKKFRLIDWFNNQTYCQNKNFFQTKNLSMYRFSIFLSHSATLAISSVSIRLSVCTSVCHTLVLMMMMMMMMKTNYRRMTRFLSSGSPRTS